MPTSTVDADLAKRFPAKFSAEILGELVSLLADEQQRVERPIRVLDAFAGTGLIHTLATDVIETTGVELEPDLVALHERTEVGDALQLRFGSGEFDCYVTSPTYGNRMADLYAGDARGSKRMTYRIALGHDPALGSSCGLQWGEHYRSFHRRAWQEANRVTAPGGLGRHQRLQPHQGR